MWLNSEMFSLGLVYFSGLFFKGKVPQDKKVTQDGQSRGFGEDIPWRTLDGAIMQARNDRTPVMVIIHKSWCPACKALKPVVAASREIKDLSKHFIMVNLADDEEPRDKKFAPDGPYIPRILFLNANGDVMTQFINEIGNPTYKYYYSDSNSIVRSMRKVIDAFDGGSSRFSKVSNVQKDNNNNRNDDYVSDIYDDINSHNEL